MGRAFQVRIVTAALGCGFLVAGLAHAEIWNCRDFDRFGTAIGDPVVVAITGETDGIGSIEISETTHIARYEVEEGNRLWIWGNEADGASPHALRIHQDGSGALFDLGSVTVDEIAHVSRRLVCEQAFRGRLLDEATPRTNR